MMLSRLRAPHLAHLTRGKDRPFHLATCLHLFSQTQVYTCLKSRVKPAFKNLCSQRDSHPERSIYVTWWYAVFLNVVSIDLSILLDNFTVLVLQGFLKQGPIFLNQIDTCKVAALDITAAQAADPGFPLELSHYLPHSWEGYLKLRGRAVGVVATLCRQHQKPFTRCHPGPAIGFPNIPAAAGPRRNLLILLGRSGVTSTISQGPLAPSVPPPSMTG